MKAIADISVLIFVVSSLLSIGLSLTWTQVVAPLRQIRLMTLALLVNFVAVPALAVAITKGLSLSEPQSVGLILLGAAAGAPFLPKLIEAARGDVALSVAVMVLLMVSSVVYLPIVLPLLLPGVSVNSLKIAQTMLVTMILPLTLGLGLKVLWPFWAQRLNSLMKIFSQLSLVTALALVCIHEFRGLVELSATMAIPACALLLGLSYTAGFAVGDRRSDSSRVLGFATSARNIPAAMLVGGQNFEHPHVVLTIVLSALLSVVLLVPLAVVQSRRPNAL